MKKNLTKILISPLFAGLALSGITVKAQVATPSAPIDKKDQPAITSTPAVDTSFHPVRRVWGYTFGDFYYAAQAPSLVAPPAPGVLSSQGKETNYYGVPGGRNAFQFRRIYLGYDYDIDKRFSVQLLLASEPAANTGLVASGTGATAVNTTTSNGDDLADSKMSFYIKLINLRWKGIYSGADLVVGSMATPGWANFSEQIWGYRSIEKTVADFHGSNSYDIGAAIQGVFDPITKNYGYDVMIGDNTQAKLLPAASAGNGFFKAVYGDLWLKALDKTLTVQLYGDYMQTASSSLTQPGLGTQSHNMLKAFVAYSIPAFTIGVEGYTNTFKNGLTVKTPASTPDLTVQNARAEAISIFAHAPISKKLNVFARYDSYNPDNESFNGADVYSSNTTFSNYDPFTKEEFFTGGLDFTPAKNVHFMPNIWYIKYKDQRDASTTGYEVPAQTLVYRLTFFYQFGK